MKKITLSTSVFLLLFCFATIAQKKQNISNPFERVKVPDNIFLQLEAKYKEIAGHDSVNAGRNVWNLLEPKNFAFKEGIYSYKGQGPHFPRLIFIYKNEQIFAINAIGAFEPSEVISDYLKCVNELKLSDTEIRKYLKAISQYLTQEQGQTYGREYKKAN